MSQEHERRILFHLLSRHNDAPFIVDRIRPEMLKDELASGIYSILAHFFLHSSNYMLTVDSLIHECEQRVKDKKRKEAMVRYILRLVDFESSTKADLSHSVEVVRVAFKREFAIQHIVAMAEKIKSAATTDSIEENIAALWEALAEDDGDSIRSMDKEVDFIKRNYEEVEKGTGQIGIATPFAAINKVLTLRRRHFWIFGGYTGQGKTRNGIEFAYETGMVQKKRTMIISLEMDREEIEILLCARHCHTIGHPINVRDIENGRLSDDDKRAFYEALEFFRSCPIDIWTPGDVTITDVRRRIAAYQVSGTIDLVVVDYLQLLQPERFRSDREELSDLMRGCKRLARQQKIPLLGLHQMSRTGFTDACSRGYYELRDLAGSSEVEKNADLVAWSLFTPDMRRANEMRIGVAKNRHGPPIERGFPVYTDYARCLITETTHKTPGDVFFDDFVK